MPDVCSRPIRCRGRGRSFFFFGRKKKVLSAVKHMASKYRADDVDPSAVLSVWILPVAASLLTGRVKKWLLCSMKLKECVECGRSLQCRECTTGALGSFSW